MFGDSAKGHSKKQKAKEENTVKKKRDDFTVEIRKQQREDEFSKMRNLDSANANTNLVQSQIKEAGKGGLPAGEEGLQKLTTHIDECLKREYTDAEFFGLVQDALSDDILRQHFAVIGFRKLLARQENPPIQAMIDNGMIPRLIQFILKEDHPHLQLESAWALTNIASGTSQQTEAIIDKGGIPLFVNLLFSKHLPVAQQAIWAIGNIAGDCTDFRDQIIKYGGIEGLKALLSRTKQKKIIRHATWALANLCRGKPLPDYEDVKGAVPIFCAIINEAQENEILSEALWALVDLTEGEDDERVTDLLATGILPRLIDLLKDRPPEVLIADLRIISNALSGSEEQTDACITAGVLDQFVHLLDHPKKGVLREVCLSLSNITAGTENQVDQVISYDALITKLARLTSSTDAEIRREAIWVLANATNHGTPDHIMKLVQLGILERMKELLESDDNRTVAVVLEGVYYILKSGQDHQINQDGDNPYMIVAEQVGIMALIEKLQSHQDNDIYLKALLIIETFCETEQMI